MKGIPDLDVVLQVSGLGSAGVANVKINLYFSDPRCSYIFYKLTLRIIVLILNMKRLFVALMFFNFFHVLDMRIGRVCSRLWYPEERYTTLCLSFWFAMEDWNLSVLYIIVLVGRWRVVPLQSNVQKVSYPSYDNLVCFS